MGNKEFILHPYRYLRTLKFSEGGQAIVMCSPYEIQKMSVFTRNGYVSIYLGSLGFFLPKTLNFNTFQFNSIGVTDLLVTELSSVTLARQTGHLNVMSIECIP